MDVFVVFEDDGEAGFVPCNGLLFYLNEEEERGSGVSGGSGSGGSGGSGGEREGKSGRGVLVAFTEMTDKEIHHHPFFHRKR